MRLYKGNLQTRKGKLYKPAQRLERGNCRFLVQQQPRAGGKLGQRGCFRIKSRECLEKLLCPQSRTP